MSTTPLARERALPREGAVDRDPVFFGRGTNPLNKVFFMNWLGWLNMQPPGACHVLMLGSTELSIQRPRLPRLVPTFLRPPEVAPGSGSIKLHHISYLSTTPQWPTGTPSNLRNDGITSPANLGEKKSTSLSGRRRSTGCQAHQLDSVCASPLSCRRNKKPARFWNLWKRCRLNKRLHQSTPQTAPQTLG